MLWKMGSKGVVGGRHGQWMGRIPLAETETKPVGNSARKRSKEDSWVSVSSKHCWRHEIEAGSEFVRRDSATSIRAARSSFWGLMDPLAPLTLVSWPLSAMVETNRVVAAMVGGWGDEVRLREWGRLISSTT